MILQDKINESIAFLSKQGIEQGAIGIVLGTGLGDLISHLSIEKEVPYIKIPNMPTPSMEYQKGRLVYGTMVGKKVLVFEGRFHAYEGLSYFEITYPIRIMAGLGVSHLAISNAAGAINLSFQKGELMLLEDHINLQGGSPLAEKGTEALGPRYLDMLAPYSIKMNELCLQIAAEQGLVLHRGVYVAVVGPQLETRSEYRYLKVIGADAVGMSTVPEVIVANQLQIPCVAFSVLTDVCDPDNLQPINIDDIMSMAKKAEQSLIIIVKKLISIL